MEARRAEPAVGEVSLAALAAVANENHAAAEQACRQSVRHAIAAGLALISAKKLVGHGNWLTWVESHLTFAPRTASLYMRLAAMPEANRQRVADLSLREAARAVADRGPAPVLAAGPGANSRLIRDAARLYVADDAEVADVTYGRGAFWTQTDLKRFRLHKSDINPAADDVVTADLRSLPYADASMDVVVLDPPYGSVLRPCGLTSRYWRGTPAPNHDATRALYRAGMAEALRVLRPGGLLWVKCKDEVERGQQCWSHIEIYGDATALGLNARDLMVVLTGPPGQGGNGGGQQRYAWKNFSFLWIFGVQQ
jgi:hypothetical protein